MKISWCCCAHFNNAFVVDNRPNSQLPHLEVWKYFEHQANKKSLSGQDCIVLLMMAKRDLTKEILAVKSRSEFYSRFDYSSRLHDIEYAFEEFFRHNGGFNNELLRYIPIATISCFEAFFRSTIKEIIDHGKPFSDYIGDYNQAKNVRLDFDAFMAITSKSLTVGEFIAHLLPYNNIYDIDSNLSIATGGNFLKDLRKYPWQTFSIPGDNLDVNFEQQYDTIMSSVERTYELRHIFCHEFATNVRIDSNEIKNNFSNCKLFLHHTNNYIYNLLFPNAPITQAEMNAQAQDEFANAKQQLNLLIQEIKNAELEHSDYPFNEKLFDQSIELWNIYREGHAKFSASAVDGGSLATTFYYETLTSLTRQKIDSLENEFSIALRRTRASTSNLPSF